MFGLRQKLSLGFGGLLVIIVVIGVQSIRHFSRLGVSIDVILRENYRSVIACQQMKEALERIDSGLLFTLLGETSRGRPSSPGTRPFPRGPSSRAGYDHAARAKGKKPRASGTSLAGTNRRLPASSDAGLPSAVRRDAYFGRCSPCSNGSRDARTRSSR